MREKSYVEDIDRSIYDFKDDEKDAYKVKAGLTPEIVQKISDEKKDPAWMQLFRLRSLQIYNQMPIPDWGPSIEALNMDDIVTYVRPNTKMKAKWSDVPDDIKNTFERLGIPQAERKSLAGVGAQKSVANGLDAVCKELFGVFDPLTKLLVSAAHRRKTRIEKGADRVDRTVPPLGHGPLYLISLLQQTAEDRTVFFQQLGGVLERVEHAFQSGRGKTQAAARALQQISAPVGLLRRQTLVRFPGPLQPAIRVGVAAQTLVNFAHNSSQPLIPALFAKGVLQSLKLRRV